jgi:hypothetical protein
MNRHILSLFNLIVAAMLLSSCERVIDLKLNASSSQIVIAGNVYDQIGPYFVQISKSVNFDQSNSYPAVSGATVIISDNTGNIDTLTESLPGIYKTSSLKGVPGRTYQLSVYAQGKRYTAVSTMPPPVRMDSIYFSRSIFGNEEQITVDFVDPSNTDNYYRLIGFINDLQESDISILSDQLFQGKSISYSMMARDSDSPFKKGDKVAVWLESIDKNVFEYFRTAGREGGQSASPANPTSNISNGALGYFNACAVRKKSIVYP